MDKFTNTQKLPPNAPPTVDASESILWLNANGKLLRCNAKFAEELGYTEEELSDKTIQDINPHASRMSWRFHWQKLSKEKNLVIETELISKKGMIFPVKMLSVLSDFNDSPCAVCFVSNTLETNRYKTLLDMTSEQVKIGGFEWDLIKEVFLVTDSVYSILALPKEEYEINFSNFEQYFPVFLNEEQLPLFANAMQEAATTGKGFGFEFKINNFRKEEIWVYVSAQPVVSDDQTIKVYGTLQDITEQKSNAESLYLYKFTLDNSSDNIFLFGPDGRIHYVNQVTAQRMGFTQEELQNMYCWELSPEYPEERWPSFWQELTTEKFLSIETPQRQKDGSLHPVQANINHILYKGKEFACASVRNISKQKERETALQTALQRVEELKEKVEAENIVLKEEVSSTHQFNHIISRSDKYRKLVLHKVEEVAPTNATVLITGETGTGKELIANAVHQHSKRQKEAMVKVNCATLPENLIESELFGHEKGAFTGAYQRKIGRFELAHKGTVFLDEIGELPLFLQPKLLRILQEGEFERVGGTETIKVDVRIIAATNRNLPQLVKEGKFRNDLFYRLNVFPIENLPLRDRMDDIPLLVNHFIEKFSEKTGNEVKGIAQESLQTLLKYSFPGNVRELENIIERAVILTKGATLQINSVLNGHAQQDLAGAQEEANFKSFDEVQRDHILAALDRTHWRISGANGAANLLGMNAKTLESKMRKFKINRNTGLNP